MINICFVKNGDLYGPEYVNILSDMILRNLNGTHKLKMFCFTHDGTGIDEHIKIMPLPENLTGWWAKLYLFKDGLFSGGERIIYIDLSTVIVSGLDDIFRYEGDFAIVRDFLRPDGWQSCFMSWKTNSMGYVWDKYVDDGFLSIEGGDQAWIEKVVPKADIWQEMFPEKFVSFKLHCDKIIPAGASVVKFHGVPMPHTVLEGWVPKIWKIGGGSSLELATEGNTHLDKITENVRYAINAGLFVMSTAYPSHEEHAVIVGGGPSINDFVEEIKRRKEDGQGIISLNNSWRWLERNNITADYQVMLDARAENIDFVPPKGSDVLRLYATQCDKGVIDAVKDGNVRLWNSYIKDVADNITDRDMFWIGSGTTVGIRSLFLFYAMGYRKFHLYGYDSSYQEEEGHAYEQKLNHGEKVLEILVGDRKFKAAPWMVAQAQNFLEAAEYLTDKGCLITIHGDGLLPYMAQTCLSEIPEITEFGWRRGDTAADMRCKAILERIKDTKNPMGVEVGVFAGDLSKRLLRRQDLILTMVDSWEEHGKESQYAASGDFHGKLTNQQQEDFYQHTLNVTQFADARRNVVRASSLEAASHYADNLFDFVFLDADHTYEAVKSDIAAWYPKVKPGGFLCGHDYMNPSFPAWGVERAVSEFCQEKNLTVDLGLNFTWFTKKGEENVTR